jgi:hypothetical protein
MLFGWSNEGDQMGGLCGMFGGEEKEYLTLVGMSERKNKTDTT